MIIVHRCSQNNFPKIICSFGKAESVTDHLQIVKCHEDRFSGLVVVPRELLLHRNGSMRKSAQIIAGRLKNEHLYQDQSTGRSRCFRAGEVTTGLQDLAREEGTLFSSHQSRRDWICFTRHQCKKWATTMGYSLLLWESLTHMVPYNKLFLLVVTQKWGKTNGSKQFK